MIKIRKDNVEKTVTKGAYDNFYKGLGFEIADSIVKEQVVEDNIKEEVKEAIVQPVEEDNKKELEDFILNELKADEEEKEEKFEKIEKPKSKKGLK